MTDGDHRSVFLSASVRLRPQDAVAAILVDEHSRYLLQLRDSYEHIFYPEHWGCFGGAVEQGETTRNTLLRELEEELSFVVRESAIRYFTTFTMDFGFADRGDVFRIYFEIRIKASQKESFQLGEGRTMQFFGKAEALTEIPLVPYDAYALWMHSNRSRLSPP